MPQSSAIDPELAKNLKSALKKQGRTAYSVATALGVSPNWLYRVVNMDRGIMLPKLRELAAELGVSVGELVDPPSTGNGQVAPGDPAPVDNRVREEARKREGMEAALQSRDQELDRLRTQAAATAEHPDPDVSPIQSAPGWHDEDYESVRRYGSEDVRLAAGTGTFADQEPVPGEVKFLKSWLRDHHLRAKDLFLADVSGDSMETTIYGGDSALVDESRTSPRSGRIYALRTGDGLLVKRLRKRDHRWWADSDNKKYEPQTLDDRARIMGRVVWWAHTDC